MSAAAASPSDSTPAHGRLLTHSAQESIQNLRYFSTLVLHAAQQSPDRERAREAFAAAFAAECLACGIRADGQELLALAEAGSAPLSPKLERIAKGYCARRTCDSRFYQLTCNPAPGVDWSPIFAIKEGYVSAPEEINPEPAEAPRDRKRPILLAAGAVGVILLLALAWQLYAGGSIPFIREPEKFQVDVMPDPLLGTQ